LSIGISSFLRSPVAIQPNPAYKNNRKVVETHMKSFSNEKHTQPLPSLRRIRRACQRELYRTVKKLKTFINDEQMKAGEQIYTRKVVLNLPWIAENGSNRKKLADWWEEHVCADIAQLWNVESSVLAKAFRDSFDGG
jgi:hypothetical protein